MLHLNNLEYSAEQQICRFNCHLEHHISQSAIDEEVKLLIEADIKHDLMQQSLLDDIRCFNIRSVNDMNYNIKH